MRYRIALVYYWQVRLTLKYDTSETLISFMEDFTEKRKISKLLIIFTIYSHKFW